MSKGLQPHEVIVNPITVDLMGTFPQLDKLFNPTNLEFRSSKPIGSPITKTLLPTVGAAGDLLVVHQPHKQRTLIVAAIDSYFSLFQRSSLTSSSPRFYNFTSFASTPGRHPRNHVAVTTSTDGWKSPQTPQKKPLYHCTSCRYITPSKEKSTYNQ